MELKTILYDFRNETRRVSARKFLETLSFRLPTRYEISGTRGTR